MKKIALAVAALLISVSAMAGNNYKLPFVSFGIKAGYTTNRRKATTRHCSTPKR